MYYVLDICPKCMDKLYERERLMNDEEYYAPVSGASCPTCGHRLIEACVGEKKPDSAVYDTKYKIFIRYTPDSHEKEVTEEGFALEGRAESISGMLIELKSNDISYEIEPPYPYEIPVYKKLWTEEDVELLKAMNPGLNVTAEELNALN